MIQQLNRVELKGRVGSAKINTAGNRRVANFTVATNYSYKAASGDWVDETTWHTVCAWEGNGVTNLDNLTKGTCVYVCGRIRNRKYTKQDGTEVEVVEILATEVDILSDEKKPEAPAKPQPKKTDDEDF